MIKIDDNGLFQIFPAIETIATAFEYQNSMLNKIVLTGKITNWKELGGEDKPINLIIREGKGSGVGSTAREMLFGDKNYEFSKKAKILKTSGPIRKAVIADPYAFAIDDVTSSQRIKGIKLLKVDGINPTKKNILNKKYKLRRPFFLYLDRKPEHLAKEYIDFALSDEGQAVISKTGTANLDEATGAGDEENLIFQNLKFNIKTK
jgi:phosphate transport system substrate-binding protein